MTVYNRVDTVGTDGTRVQNLTPTTGGSWFDLNEVWRVSSNRGARAGDASTTTRLNTSSAIAVSDYDVDLLIRATTLSGDTTEIGIEGRRSAASNDDYYQLAVDATTVSLSKRVGADSGTALDSASWSPAIDTDYVLTLRVDGTSIVGLIDGVEVVSATDSAHAGPGHVCVVGSGASAGATGWQWEYVEVKDVEAASGIAGTATAALGLGVVASGALAIAGAVSAALGVGVSALGALAITGSATAPLGLGVSASGAAVVPEFSDAGVITATLTVRPVTVGSLTARTTTVGTLSASTTTRAALVAALSRAATITIASRSRAVLTAAPTHAATLTYKADD